MSRSVHVRTYGGVSVVNGIPSFKGATMAINLPVDVEVREADKGVNVEFEEFKASPNLIVKIAEEALRRLRVKTGLHIRVRSKIPPTSGLKSSSAVSTAVYLGVLKLFNAKIDAIDVLKSSARACIELGVSVTGAFDDASASLFGGIQITDNREMEIIKSLEPPRDVRVVVGIPSSVSKRIFVSEMRKYSNVFEQIFNTALRGDIWTAMTLNGILIANILRYDLTPIMTALENGALAAGISGNGPAYFAVAYTDCVKALAAFLEGNVMVLDPVELRSVES